jgi:carboxyl-terminal processing protease
MRVQTRGEFGGLGIEVTQEKGFVKVVAPIDDTPAARRHRGGRLITHVDGESVAGPDAGRGGRPDARPGGIGDHHHRRAARAGRTLRRGPSSARRSSISAVRSRLEDDMRWSCASPPSTSRPSRTCEDQLKEQVEAAGGIENVNGFVIDLRNNPGGLLDQAIR